MVYQHRCLSLTAAVAIVVAAIVTVATASSQCKIKKADTVVVDDDGTATIYGAIAYRMGEMSGSPLAQFSGKNAEFTGRPTPVPFGPVIVYVFKKISPKYAALLNEDGIRAKAGAAYRWTPGSPPSSLEFICTVDTTLHPLDLAMQFGVGRGAKQAKADKERAARAAENRAEEERVRAKRLEKEAKEIAADAERNGIKTSEGLVFLSMTKGVGPVPGDLSIVKFRYEGRLVSGPVFVPSRVDMSPLASLSATNKCLALGIRMTAMGGKSRLVCPPDLAYGDVGGPGGVQPGATVMFDVEVIEIY